MMIKCVLIALFISFLFLIVISVYFGGQLGRIKEEILWHEEQLKNQDKK